MDSKALILDSVLDKSFANVDFTNDSDNNKRHVAGADGGRGLERDADQQAASDRSVVVNPKTGATLEILSSDVSTSGENPASRPAADRQLAARPAK
jgi:hypothetical protein